MSRIIPGNGHQSISKQTNGVWNAQAMFEAEQLITRCNEIVQNQLGNRMDWMRGRFYGESGNIDKECGYPWGTGVRGFNYVDPQFYRDLYDKHAIAARVVELFPKESWKVQPFVYEDADSDTNTPFEDAWDELGSQMKSYKSWHKQESGSEVWEKLYRLDMLSRIGTFAVLLIGINDGKLLLQPVEGMEPDRNPMDVTGATTATSAAELSKDIYGAPQTNPPTSEAQTLLGTDAQYLGTTFTPPLLPGMPGPDNDGKGKRKITFIRPFDESLVQVVRYEASINSPRFGQPVLYRITMNDPRQWHSGIGLPLASLYVHWTRVIHVPGDDRVSSEIFSQPTLQQLLPNTYDLRKLYGGSAEMYWRGALPGFNLTTHPQLGGDVIIDRKTIGEAVDRYFEGLSRVLITSGMEAKTMAPQVVDPSPQIAAQLECISIRIGCPMRVLKGSERGELASSQDDSDWNERMAHRQGIRLTPVIIAPLIDRLIAFGILPEPESYEVEWPDMDATSKKDKAAIALQKTQALAAWVSSGAENAMPLKPYLSTFTDMMTDEQAEAIEEQAVGQMGDDSEKLTQAATTPPPPVIAPAVGGKPGQPPKAGANRAPQAAQPGKPAQQGATKQ